MLTFETLFELLRKEKINPELQKVEDEFYNLTSQYLEEKHAVLKTEQSSDSIFSSDSKRTMLQLENAKKIIKELYEKRENKIVNLANFLEEHPRLIRDEELRNKYPDLGRVAYLVHFADVLSSDGGRTELERVKKVEEYISEVISGEPQAIDFYRKARELL